MAPEIIGYTSSLILLITIGSQSVRLWRDGGSKGTSLWLYLGQIAASVGFTIYSILTKSTVFTLSNATTALAATASLAIVLYHRRKNGSAPVELMGTELPRKYAA